MGGKFALQKRDQKFAFKKYARDHRTKPQKGEDHLKIPRYQKWGSPTVFELHTPNSYQTDVFALRKSPWGQIFKFLPLKVISVPF